MMQNARCVDRELSCEKLKTRIEIDFADDCFHLLISKGYMIWEPMITERNKQKGRTLCDPAISL